MCEHSLFVLTLHLILIMLLHITVEELIIVTVFLFFDNKLDMLVFYANKINFICPMDEQSFWAEIIACYTILK